MKKLISIISIVPKEPSFKCYLIAFIYGWGKLLDGIIGILSLGRLHSSIGFKIVTWLAKERHEIEKPIKGKNL